MAKPAIITVDDDPQVLAAVERDLRQRYAAAHRIIKAASGAEALEALGGLKQRGDTVALIVADQRMPQMTGTEFLLAAAGLFPQARTVLLTAYADTEAAIQAINDVGLDHYLMKPWDPPEERLYPVLDDLLDDWQPQRRCALRRHPGAGHHLVAAHPRRQGLPGPQPGPVPIPRHRARRRRAARSWSRPGPSPDLPLVLFPDGTTLHATRAAELSPTRSACRPRPRLRFYDLIVVGRRARRAGRRGVRRLRRAADGADRARGHRRPGGHLLAHRELPGVSQRDLGHRPGPAGRRPGADASAAEIITAGEVVGVTVEDPVKVVTLADGSHLSCRALIIATGMTTRTLGVPG